MVYGKLILWLKAEKNYTNPVRGIDYSIVNSGACSRNDGQPITGMDAGYEWLADFVPFATPDYDPRIWILVQSSYPTNVAHPEFPNYKTFQTTYTLEKRTNEAIIASIRQAEASANNKLATEAEMPKMAILANAANTKVANNTPLTEGEQAAIDLNLQVSVKMTKNSANAILLIEQVNAGQEPLIDEGWEIDNLLPVGQPFIN